MKRLVLTAIAVAALPALLVAQGTVSFGSSTTNQYFQYPNAVKAAGITVELWWSPDNSWPYQKIASTTTATGAAAGYIAPSVVATTGAATPGGNGAWFYVYGWIISDHHWDAKPPPSS